MKRRGITTIEVMVILALLMVVISLLYTAICNFNNSPLSPVKVVNQRICKVVALKEVLNNHRDYRAYNQGSFIFRVIVANSNAKLSEPPATDLELVPSTTLDVLANANQKSKQINSEILQANLEVGRWYVFTIENSDEPLSNIISAQPIPHGAIK